MATTTFAYQTTADWTSIAEGASSSSAWLQLGGSGAAALVVAASAPAADTPDWVVLSPTEGLGEITVPLATGDTLYCRAAKGLPVVRGYLVGV